MKKLLLLSSVATLSGCATITNDSYMPMALSFSDGSSGMCNISNKRFTEKVEIPSTPPVFDVRTINLNMIARPAMAEKPLGE